eukprot:4425949-Prymnesium_polylepis.1
MWKSWNLEAVKAYCVKASFRVPSRRRRLLPPWPVKATGVRRAPTRSLQNSDVPNGCDSFSSPG